jgi:hypothetical protein
VGDQRTSAKRLLFRGMVTRDNPTLPMARGDVFVILSDAYATCPFTRSFRTDVP